MKALQGMVVIDFTQAFSGPFCTMQLADFGATVIKIERPYIGDQSREWTPFSNGYSGYYASINRNKYGIAVDNASPEGGEIIKELIKNADIVVENFKVGTLEKFGLGYEDIREVNPQIIYASISGFGQTSSLKKLPAYDNVIQSVTGFQSITGFPETVGVRCGSAVGDSFTGMNCALAILMAYRRKIETGQGCRIDISMFDCIFGILEPHILSNTVNNESHERAGNSDKYLFSPCDVYECKDGWFSIGITNDNDFAEFCRITGKEELLENEKFATNSARCANNDELTEAISGYFKDKTRKQLEDIFTEIGIINAPLLTIPEIVDHEQTRARNMIVEMDDPGVGKYFTTGNPMHLSETPASYDKGAPLMGQDTAAVLKAIGYDDSRIEELVRKKVIQCI